MLRIYLALLGSSIVLIGFIAELSNGRPLSIGCYVSAAAIVLASVFWKVDPEARKERLGRHRAKIIDTLTVQPSTEDNLVSQVALDLKTEAEVRECIKLMLFEGILIKEDGKLRPRPPHSDGPSSADTHSDPISS